MGEIYPGWGWDTGYPRPILRTANVNEQIVAHYILCQSLFSCMRSFWVVQWFVVSRETWGVGVGRRAPHPITLTLDICLFRQMTAQRGLELDVRASADRG